MGKRSTYAGGQAVLDADRGGALTLCNQFGDQLHPQDTEESRPQKELAFVLSTDSRFQLLVRIFLRPRGAY